MQFDPLGPCLALGGQKFGLDAAGDACFVSHAHSDHTGFIRASHKVIASQATLDLLYARTGKRKESLESVAFGGARVSLHESGHVLGAKQVAVEADGSKFVYTGDFNTTASLTCPAAEVVRCDELLLDCTYGSPQWVFPPRQQVYEEIAKWAQEQQEKGFITLFGAYSLGKAQELVAILNNHLGTAPLVSGMVEAVCRVYNKHGAGLDFVGAGGEEAAGFYNEAFAAIVPMNSLSMEAAANIGSHYRKPVRTAVATGWALHQKYYGVDAAFPLSDHPDYEQLLEFIEATGASKVWCTHGPAGEFASELRGRGLNALGVEEALLKQKNLLEY